MTAESVPADRLIGQTLADRYQILHRLGEGAMGAVYKARHVKVGRTFAVKVLHARLLQDPKVALRFEREAELAGRLRHANVVGVVDVGEIDGLRYMVMDFAEGPDLAQLLVEAPMPGWRIIHLVRQMLEGLYHAHEQGLIHRDFKPENVIVERDSHGAELPRIVDFGIAILRDGSDTLDSHGRLTTNGLVLGTPHYMAPEQAVADPIDHRIDLFALGIVIYEMLSGRLPFDGSGAEVARANLLLEPPPIVQRVPYLEVDPLLEAFVRRLMAKKPQGRPATAKAARELLDLIDRDRPAAGAMLGVPPELSARPPAETTSLISQSRVPYAVPVSAATRRLRATPSPSAAVAPPAGPPPAAMSLAFSAPAALESQPIPKHAIAHETSIRAPLSWPGTQAMTRRTPLIIGGAAFCAIGLIAVLLARHGAKPPATEDRVVMAPLAAPTASPVPVPTADRPAVPASPTAPAPAPGPTSTVPAVAPSAPGPAAPPPSPTVAPATPGPAAPTPGEVDVANPPQPDPIAPGPTGTGLRRTKRAAPHDAKPARPAARPHRGRPGDRDDSEVVVTDDDDDAPADPRGAAQRPSARSPIRTAEPAQPAVGISATELARLYNDVGNQLGRLPREKVQDLWRQYELLHYGSLMSAAPAQRDEAAASLWRIAAEARRLSK
jgi:serine/threonine-protein kinase